MQPALNAREKYLEPETANAIAKSSRVKLLLAGATRLGDLLFAFPAIDYLLHCGMVKDLSVACHRYVTPLLPGVNGEVGHMVLPDHNWNIFNRWRTIRHINQQSFDLALVLNGKRSARKLLAATKIPAVFIEQPNGTHKTANHLHTVRQARSRPRR